jgi:hypothetical protein
MFRSWLTNVGSGPTMIGTLTGATARPDPREAAATLDSRGYSPMSLEMPDGSIPPSRQRFLDRARRYRERRKQFEARPRDVEPTPVASAAIEAQVAFLAERGLVPIYVMPPLLSPPEAYEALARRGTIPHFLSFASPALFPQLFERASRWDEQHLSRRGARLWSARLAEDLATIFPRATKR